MATDPILLMHDSLDAAEASGLQLKALGPRARAFLEECVEHQTITRRTASKVAEQLCDLGFIFIRDTSDVFHKEVSISASLQGEEALEALGRLDLAERGRRVC